MAEVSVQRHGAIAVLTLSNPPLNPLSAELTALLSEALQTQLSDPSVAALVLLGSGDTFVAGADIRKLQALAAAQPSPPPPDTARQQAEAERAEPKQTSQPSLTELITLLEHSSKPVVAAIDGFALGGGLELAMGCHARVATRTAKLGLPELKLGLIPGAGGTQRLPRLIGVTAALNAMLSSRQLPAEEAERLGLVDHITPREQLLEVACQLARQLAESVAQGGAQALRRSSQLADKLGSAADSQAAVDAAREEFGRHFSHGRRFPELCLDAVLCGVLEGSQRGLLRERECFEDCLKQEAARGLIHLFFAQRSASKVPQITDRGLKARRFNRSAVIGGGTMGAGIAASLLGSRFEVTLVERDATASQLAEQRVRKILGTALAKGRIDVAEHDARLARLRCSSSLGDLSSAELVIEAATEDLQLKREVFGSLLKLCPADTLLATNTSTLPLQRIAEDMPGGERILGAHFFSPAHIMPLVEVVRTPRSEPQHVVDLLGLVRALGKTAVVVGSCVGFLVNRVFMPYGQAVGLLIDRGHDPYAIDRVMLEFGMPMGPCRVSDLAGVDVGVFAGNILDAAYPERAYRSQLRRLLAEAGRLGEKTGLGHYRYSGKQAEQDPELASFVERARAEAGKPEQLELSDQDVVQLLLFVVVNEACRVLEEGHVVRASDVDLALHLGMGFPGFRGGPMKWADQFGARYVVRRLSEWRQLTGCPLFQSSDRLQRLAEQDASLLSD